MSAFQSAHYLEIACFTLLVYDLLTTFGEEVEYFWSGPWSISRVLFFLNRYLPFVVMISGLVVRFLLLNALTKSCTHWIRAAFELSIIVICINQGILFLRVWYMYSHSAIARAVACFSYAGCALSSLITMGLSLSFLKSTTESLQLQRKITAIPGCSAPAPSMIWTVFVPSTIIHTILFGFTIARVVKVSRDLQMDQLMQRLIRDGGLVFFVSMASATFSVVGARLTTDPVINGPATWSNSQLAISAVAVSRLMLSIRSLAGKLKINQDWLFNPSELSRVRWRAVSGDYSRIIIVEMDTHEPVA
ncbi:uncharacterized protein BJ212DRAFT_1270482 [Suillus subaureus]|uniref:DUF6533 domain-containing protein n=1 Tax=Suillus subaureus TaxID=48587 RepID=A0A9P7EBP7_9AGAM|nr:uncharacterized protein BJ212DRAFT_1270482 [Suillus subaureus]KAG1817159.1 hypothetical protein BJ212DRAFT_1270482 [Suillus subaureus]